MDELNSKQKQETGDAAALAGKTRVEPENVNMLCVAVWPGRRFEAWTTVFY